MQDPSKPIWINKSTKTIDKSKDTSLPKIFVATPVHSECSIHYTQALLQFQQQCMVRGIMVSFSLLKSSLVTQGRNLCVNGFLEAEDKYSHLLFIDSDIDFTFETIMKMINADKEVIACPYPLKHLDWFKIDKRIKLNKELGPELLSKQGYIWPVKIGNSDNIVVENGVAEVSHAPTGCMLIKRQVFDKMIKAYPDKKINQPTILNGNSIEKEYLYNFFDTYHEPETKRYYGEDFGFCKRWTEIGGKCHILVEDYITHVGEYCYKGRLMDDLDFKKD
jgi:hypothetical protein